WSSDVCSSDLFHFGLVFPGQSKRGQQRQRKDSQKSINHQPFLPETNVEQVSQRHGLPFVALLSVQILLEHGGLPQHTRIGIHTEGRSRDKPCDFGHRVFRYVEKITRLEVGVLVQVSFL